MSVYGGHLPMQMPMMAAYPPGYGVMPSPSGPAKNKAKKPGRSSSLAKDRAASQAAPRQAPRGVSERRR